MSAQLDPLQDTEQDTIDYPMPPGEIVGRPGPAGT